MIGRSVEELMEHRQGAQFGESRQMEAVVALDDFEHAGTLGAVKAEEVHRGEVHAHQRAYAAGLLGHQIVVVEWGSGAERGRPEVEVGFLG